MQSLYQRDLAYIHAAAFGGFALGAAAEIVRRLRSATVQIRRVVDVGCGAGVLTKPLIDAGFDVIGIDTSAELLEVARMNAPTAHFVHGSVYEMQVGTCDAVVALGEALTYHSEATDADNLVNCFFQNVAEVLPLGGMLIFDVIGLGEPSLAGRTWSSGEDWAVLVQTSEDHTKRTLVRNIETFRRVSESYRRSYEVHSVRLFDVWRLRDQLACCGFATETAQCYGVQELLPRRRAFFATRLAAAGICSSLNEGNPT